MVGQGWGGSPRSLALTASPRSHYFQSPQFLTSVTGSFNYFDTARAKSLNTDQLTQALRHAGRGEEVGEREGAVETAR